MELKDRLKYARKQAGLTQADTAKHIGMAQGSYSELERGKSQSTAKIVQIAELFSVNPHWLATGEGSPALGKKDDQQLKRINPARFAPVINMVQAGKFAEVGQDSYDDELPVMGDYPESDVLYWLELDGNSMNNDFFSGDLVLINASRQPAPGNFVVAVKLNENSATFKKYRPKGFDENGVEYWQLIPSNPEYPIIDSRFEPFEVTGVAVERTQKLV